MNKKSKIKKLHKKIAKLKKKLAAGVTYTSGVSPLAPKDGFPKLPTIAGVQFSTIEAGVRYHGRDDVMLASLCAGTTLAGVFTKSKTRAAPVLDCQRKIGLESDQPAAILVNSGNANAFTGNKGKAAVNAVAGSVAETLGISPTRVFTSSTGVIGESLPYERIVQKIENLKAGLSTGKIDVAAQAIMTTDTFPKGASTEFQIDGQTVTIAGIAKGSGMIAPDMATMLVYIFTDAKITRDALQSVLSGLIDQTFNSITVDSDTSTSDTVIVAATGQSLAPEIKTKADIKTFSDALQNVMTNLAHQVVRDGEGATKFIEVRVSGAASTKDAHLAGMAIANSPLVKTAIAGEDPNWGRVVMAVGKSGAAADRDQLAIWFGDILVAENGWVSPKYNEDAAAKYMKNQDLVIRVDLGVGNETAVVWTCDLTHGYIEINADYRS